MATREGIYVGGHEIVERYVGNQLVWSKWIFVGSFQNLPTPSDSGQYLFFNRMANNQTFNTKYRDETKVREVKIRIQSSYNTAYVYAKYVQIHFRNTGEDNYDTRNTLSIKFRDENQKNEFKKHFTKGASLFFYIR
uniref:Uncharacterized protein n=1 Tax=Siphoviridae sp. ctKyp3 TaxID=2825447 RepID=A0A8S5QB92_9CAUD|nr:MAG TPA: hypothetical protein [Siphoviridae sp. ctKyp3]